MVSNFHLITYGYTAYRIFAHGYGWGKILGYVLFATAAWFVERLVGLNAIRYLNSDYTYLESTMYASFMYLIGYREHITEYPFMSIEWPEESGDSISPAAL